MESLGCICKSWMGYDHEADLEALAPIPQWLLNVPFWVYWTSPYSSHYRPYTYWLGDVQWGHLMTHVPTGAQWANNVTCPGILSNDGTATRTMSLMQTKHLACPTLVTAVFQMVPQAFQGNVSTVENDCWLRIVWDFTNYTTNIGDYQNQFWV